MNIVTTVLATLVALEFFYIMYIETFATQSDATSRTFKMSKEELSRPSVVALFKNQGIYNGLIGVGLLYATYFSSVPKEMTLVFLIYIVLVAAYGSLTSSKDIILKQGGLAILALISLFF